MNAVAANAGGSGADAGWDAEAYGRHARFVADRAASLVDWLAPAPGERILDLGCGDGALSERIAAHGADVLGLDSSMALLAAARERGLSVQAGDGQRLAFTQAFDAVFSNAALHWMKSDPDAVIAGVYAALKPGGRFVAEFGVAGNVAPIREALRAEAAARGREPDALDPWVFPAPKTYLKQLETAGFSIERDDCFERPTPLPGDIDDWLTTLARPFVHAFAAGDDRRDYIRAVRARLAPVMQDADGHWTAPYVRLRFVARRPGANRFATTP
ncbi:type 11 methyltransferase [Salinisphaera orenii MK-B5]|uniref:Type 11 methyltransferase n=1 Tax=Salinisphaera orenii MK-B5 TaxID=856730 RepID=A0A423PP34_9GAMM|nr:type 11 methyltransferase [Salinisphaera orenii MK-B5]